MRLSIIILPIILMGCSTLKGPDFFEQAGMLGCKPFSMTEVKKSYEHHREVVCQSDQPIIIIPEKKRNDHSRM